MAAPSFADNFSTIILDVANDTGWTLISSGGGGQNALNAPETDDYIQGNNCISRTPWTSANIRGMLYNSAQTITSGHAVYVWQKSDVAQALSTKAAGGIQVCIGSGSGAFDAYYVDGSDDPFGGWKCFPVDPTVTSSTQVGSPTGTTSFFGVRWSIAVSGPSKGAPFKIDAMRHGSSITVTQGEVADPATFEKIDTWQSNLTRQYGLFQQRGGAYELQGTLRLGDTGLVYFDDSNRTIVIQNTEFVGSTFNKIEINNASSTINWTAISMTALGTVSRGDLECTANATLTFDQCSFTDMGLFTFNGTANAQQIKATTFRRCGEIVKAGASFTDGCTFDRCRDAVTLDAGSVSGTSVLSDVTGNTFVSDGSNHAVELDFGNSGGTIVWDNQLSGYQAGTAGNNVGITNANAAINVLDTSGTVVVDVQSGASRPSVQSAGATINVIENQVTFTVTVSDIDTGAALQGARVYVIAEAGGDLAAGTVIIDKLLTDANGQVSDVASYSQPQPYTGNIRLASSSPFYKATTISGDISNTGNTPVNVSMIKDE